MKNRPPRLHRISGSQFKGDVAHGRPIDFYLLQAPEWKRDCKPALTNRNGLSGRTTIGKIQTVRAPVLRQPARDGVRLLTTSEYRQLIPRWRNAAVIRHHGAERAITGGLSLSCQHSDACLEGCRSGISVVVSASDCRSLR